MSKEKNLYKINVSASLVLKGTKLGDSIATNGVCLTVTDLSNDYFVADIMKESLNKTTFKDIKKGDAVNLERALSLDKRLDGHIVQGHVDSLGKIIEIKNIDNFVEYKISINEDSLKEVVYKGSIAIDGISLTVSQVTDTYFKVSIIPTTINNTNLKSKKVGDLVNVETD
ncbi:MAG: riboflavin synthase, partial [Anaerococcus sp.]